MNRVDINDIIIPADMPVVEIMKRIDHTGKGIVYVCSDDRTLLGVITDGDVRRAILRTGKLDMPAEEIMNTAPVTLAIHQKEEANSLMMHKFVRSVPLLDDGGRVVEICFLDGQGGHLQVNRKIDVPVVIMAGGKGTRLQPYTNILPKPLIPIGEKTITEHIIDRFRDAGCNRYHMIVNYKKHFIKAYFRDNEIDADIDFVEEERFLGTGGGLRLLLGKVTEPFFFTNCDILIEEDYSRIMEYHQKSGNLATMVCAVKKMSIPYGVISTTEEGRITEIREKPDITSVVNTGFYVLDPAFLERIPENGESQITDIFQACIDRGDKIGMYPVSEDSWMDMGQFDELKKMTEKLTELE